MAGEAGRPGVRHRNVSAHRLTLVASLGSSWYVTASVFRYDPKLPAYDILNLRIGVRRDNWDVAFYVNNLTDERALLSLDQERGTRARIGYLTNQPRTFGIATRFDF